MSLFKELKTRPENNINIVDMLSLLCVDGKSKYVETLLRIMKSTESIEDYKKEVVKRLESEYDVDSQALKSYDTLQLIFIDKFFRDMFELKDLQTYRKFMVYNEKGLITQNDVSRYSTFEQITEVVSIADLKANEKEMEKQIVKLYETDDWLILKPLTYEASKKYGSNTKWCTTSEGESHHFDRYAKGILIYSINKKNNYKVACYKDLSGNEFSFWSQTDQKIESLESDLPMEILKLIKDEVKTCKASNLSFYKGDKNTKSLSQKKSLFYTLSGSTI
jgi:hypothetical protein